MLSIVNILGSLTAALCALLLLRAFARVHQRLLLWSGLCFAGLTLSNTLVFVDLVVIPHYSIYVWRLAVAAASLLLLLYGLIFESD
ncbi:MAG: hypothetical protein HC872_01755 [Gammaproteobacteria bacterium]|nr:hypothetical protein [Gammaproteobacteria bacterium]